MGRGLAELQLRFLDEALPTYDDTEIVPLVDGADYFSQVWQAIQKTGGEGDLVYILGWAFDDKMPPPDLPGGTVIGQLLADKAAAGVDVRVILNGGFYHPVVKKAPLERNLGAAVALRSIKRGNEAPLARRVLIDWSGDTAYGSHHQTSVLVSAASQYQAFVGSMDFLTSRYDAAPHTKNPSRNDSAWGLHGVAVRLQGLAVARVWENFRSRWQEAKTLPPRSYELMFCNTDHKAKYPGGRRQLKDILWVILHCTDTPEGGELDTALGNAKNYEKNVNPIKPSVHMFVDDGEIAYRILADDVIGNGAGTKANPYALHIEQVGKEPWSTPVWMQHEATINRCAYYVAQWCKQYQIPTRMLTVPEMNKKQKGIATHLTVKESIGGTTHTDPGPGYPIDVFLAHLKKHFNAPVINPSPIDDMPTTGPSASPVGSEKRSVQILKSRYSYKQLWFRQKTPWSDDSADHPIGTHEVFRVLSNAIDYAETFIYIEDPFLREKLGVGVTDKYSLFPHLQAAAKRGVKLIFVGSDQSDEGDVAAGSRNQTFEQAGDIRERLVDPLGQQGNHRNVVVWRIKDTIVDSRVMIVDDVFAAVGSAALHSRSMSGIDSELQVAFVDANSSTTSVVRKLRMDLWAEHLGSPGTTTQPMVRALETLDTALGIWRRTWFAQEADTDMWRVAGHPDGFDPTKSALELVGPPD